MECMGEAGPSADAEVIAAAGRFLGAIGISGYRLRIGSVGIFSDLLPASLDADDRAVVIGHLDRLMSVRERAESAARIGDRDSTLIEGLRSDRIDLASVQAEIDYSGPECIAERAPADDRQLVEWLPGEAEATYRRLWDVQGLVPDETAGRLIGVSRLKGPLAEVDQQARKLLSGTGATASLDRLLAVCRHVEMYGVGDFEVVLGIARGFTFYTSTVFEISPSGDERPEKYCGGGRYDRLVEEFGGAPVPSCGCAFRFDGLADVVQAGGSWTTPRPFELFLLAESEVELPAAVSLAEELRARGLRVGIGIGPQREPSLDDVSNRGTERVGLLSAEGAQSGMVRLSDGASVREVGMDAEAIARIFE